MAEDKSAVKRLAERSQSAVVARGAGFAGALQRGLWALSQSGTAPAPPAAKYPRLKSDKRKSGRDNMSGNKLFRNDGDGGFTQITDEPIVTEPPPSGAGTYQVAWFDYDNEGFLDACLLNGDDNVSIWTANQLFHNNGNANAWLTVKPIGTVSNRDGVGAKVRLLATYATQARWQRRDITGGGLTNGNHRYAHFGLGDATKVDAAPHRMAVGDCAGVTDVPANQILTVTEPPRLIPQGVGAFRIQSWINQHFEIQASADLSDLVERRQRHESDRHAGVGRCRGGSARKPVLPGGNAVNDAGVNAGLRTPALIATNLFKSPMCVICGG